MYWLKEFYKLYLFAMQLKLKKICLLSTIFVYCASFLLQSNIGFFQARAQEVTTPRVNIVAILVDSKIYDGISWWLKWYTAYVQSQLADTKALVIPLDLSNIHAYDIHRMMENIYFDGLENVNSSLIWLIMFGDIPLPVVNWNWYIFPTVYPYVDFENQKYVWDSESEYFVSNDNPMGQAEIWHWLVNYWNDIWAYLSFFEKIQKYMWGAEDFIWSSLWYDDFIAQKKWFLDENYPYYRNRVMFAEDLWYQRHSPLMKKMFRWEKADNSLDIVSELSESTNMVFDWKDLAQEISTQGVADMHTTKMIQQEIETSFLSDYNDLFSESSESIMRENVFAWWRWIKVFDEPTGEKSLIVDSDGSAAKMQLKDDLLLWNNDIQGLLENLNDLMENMIDRKVEEKKLGMDIVVPISYQKKTKKRINFRCVPFVSRFENYYFGSNARYVDNAEELSIYRWTYRNLLDLSWVTYDSLLAGKNPIKTNFEKTDLRLKSIWWSYDIFSNQAEWNRWYTMTSVERDLDIYDEEKTTKKALTSRNFIWRVKKRTWPTFCRDDSKKYQCETLFEFAKRWWWGASSINLISESVMAWRYELNDYLATDSWRSIFGMDGFQSLLEGDDEWTLGKWWIHWTWLWPQWDATSFKSYIKYASPTQRKWWDKKFYWYEIYENHTPDVHMNFSEINYRDLDPKIVSIRSNRKFSPESSKIFTVSSKKSSWLKCGSTTEYSYKVISSVVKHKSTTEDQINWIDRDRYWDTWTLWTYYRDLRKDYEDLQEDMSNILNEFPDLIALINSWNNLINEKFKNLYSGANVLSQINWDLSDKEWQLSSLRSELDENRYQLEELKSQLNDADESDVENIERAISNVEDIIANLESSISGVEAEIQSLQSKKAESENYIISVLNEMENYISLENTWLTNVYKLIQWLYVENIIGTLSSIAYLEGWNPDDYYDWWNSENLVTVWFLPSWISNINRIVQEVKKWETEIIDNYEKVYLLVQDQRDSWLKLAEYLKSLGDRYTSEVDKVSWDMEKIFDIEDDGKSYDEDWNEIVDEDLDQTWDDWGSMTLTWWSARVSMDVFEEELWVLSSFFSKLIVKDEVWPTIVSEAQKDSDFLLWLKKESIDYEKFSDVDWINHYAQWAKWPWYDSDWAKKNHDLLIWVSEHMSWMNILTPDRPIDSPRYTIMQSVAGNEMKFIYPDLFKVEVYVLTWRNVKWYDIHLLLTWWQIKKNLVKYLTWKVEEYNNIVKKECDNALKTNDYFDKLKTLWFSLATPDTSLHWCKEPFKYEDFVDALWWEKMLDVIANTLYYHNLTNKRKLSTWDVVWDIEMIKQSFNLNDKRSQIMKDYLTKWNEKKKHPVFEIPTYEMSGYEVAYINSDGRDYIIPSVDKSEEFSQTLIDATSDSFDIDRHQPTSQEKELDDECNIPSNWKLPIFKIWESSPWLKWFKCRWKKTLKDPLKLKLTFDASLWELLIPDSLDEAVRESDTWESFNDRWELNSRYPDKWDSELEHWTWFDSDKLITELQVKAEKHNQDAWNLSAILGTIDREIKISNTNVLLSDSNPKSELKIESLSDVWNITVEFMWTGWCISLNSNVLCGGKSFTKTFNPKTNPFTWVVVSDHVAWKDALIMKINVWWWYLEKIIKYTVSPSTLSRIELEVGDKKTIAWMITPIEAIWYDEYWNKIEWWLEKYDFTASQWRFLKDWAYQSWFSTNDFRDLRFYYQAPLEAVDWSIATIQIKSSSKWTVMKTYWQPIVQANPVVKLNWTAIIQGRNSLVANAWYSLSSDESIYIWWKLNVSKLQKLEVDIRDLNWNIVDVDSQILVTSQNWLVIVWQVNKQQDWDDVFFETSKHYMSWWHVVLYFYPTTVAGDDVINIDIPWLDTRVINYRVNPAKTVNIQLDINDEYVELHDYADFEFYASDVWWNPTTTSLELITDPKYVEFPDLMEIYRDEDTVIYLPNITNWYLKTQVYWTWAWLTEVVDATYGSDIRFKVDTHLLPETWLNIMYLNYFGNDWWNQWWYFSKNDNFVEDMMKNSEKLITTTTMIASEDKIKKLLWKIEPWFKIVNNENIDTIMTINWSKFNIKIWWLSEMNSSLLSFSWLQRPIETITTLLNDKKTSLENYIFFVPSDNKYSMKDWILYNSGERIANLSAWEVTLQLSDESLSNWDNIWKVIDRWINYWSLIIHVPFFMPKVSDFKDPGNRYLVNNVFAKWSTDTLSSVGLFDWFSEFEIESSYKSIQDSDDMEERVGFLWDFKNITLFAEWQTVWEATKLNWSELLINLWDPVLSRSKPNLDVYGTNYDWWIGQQIYVDSEDDIFWVYEIDFNWDWKKDWLYVYLDWSFKLAKNYGWTPNLREMQELMRVAVHIQDVFVWDADGNWYEDVIVLTDNNQIRAYLNYGWKFDVDGSVACLNQNVFWGQISSTPTSLEWVNQFFVEDMDKDGAADIITYDEKWYIKVFYWWSTNSKPNYLSTLKYACDTWWYDREIKNTTVVTALWVQVSNEPIYDNSMIYWDWLVRPSDQKLITEPQLPIYWVNFDPKSLGKFIKRRDRNADWSIGDLTEEIMSEKKFDVVQASKMFIKDDAKYVEVTLYENTLLWNEGRKNYVFVPSSYLDPANPEDKCGIRKNYYVKRWWWLLMNSDIVTVRVTIEGYKMCHWAFWDIIQWPWNIYYDENEVIEWLRFIKNQKNAVVKKKDWNFSYMIDNIQLAPWEQMVFEYDLEYHQLPLKKMSITYDTFWSEDDLPDIKLQSVDWCDKNFDWFVNGWRSFSKVSVPLQKLIDKEYEDEDKYTEDFAADVISYGSDANSLPWIVWDKISRIKLIQWNKFVGEVSDDESWKQTLKNTLLQKMKEWWLEAFNTDLLINLSVFEEQTDALEDIIDDITQWMCNWFSFWWSSNCKWLPVPFNQAFLAPWNYHLFGCRKLQVGPLEWWVPMFFFPWTMYVAGVSIPIPWWLKWPGDWFLWPWWWTYPSFIRIYAAPTLTAQLWIAVCMWKYMDEHIFPSPWADVAWNCVVFAVKPQCNNGKINNEKKKDLENPNPVYDEIVDEVKNSWICLQSQKWPQVTEKWYRSSPFDLYSYSSTYYWEKKKDPFVSARDWFKKNIDVNWWSNYQVDFDLNPLWIISLEMNSYVWMDDDIWNEKNSIFIWDVDILWWDYSVNKIKGWIRQWLRNLLIDKWLDPQIRYIANQLTKMHVNIRLPNLPNLISDDVQTIKSKTEEFWNIWKNEDETQRLAPITKWSDINYDNLNKFNKSISNPFEALAGLLNETNLINISVEPITVKIPMIFAEDINAYQLYLQQWLEVNEWIINQWRSVLSWANLELVNGNWQKLQNKIYANLKILEEYRNFPFEIYEWIHVIDRYMSEIVSLINSTVWYLSYWLSTNSQRFVGYVDAIVLMLNIIRTYQILIDFSVEWWQNCGTCARDTYDQYSCKLSLLCNSIQLPIIQIPNFKLPNITIDLTNIDLWLDIVLPEFNFQPVRIDLPDLLNLPEPPSVSVGIQLFDLPDIPLLPEPPELPELPSFIPEVEMELPILPPAPELPKLPNEIESIVKVAKIIWKIYCIVKWKFGLVWESSVKAKIEQLTQRTYEVKWIDNIMDFTNFSVAPVHNYWLDYEISSYVDLQFNFADFYNYLDTLTKWINNLTTSSVNRLNREVDSMVSNNPLEWIRDAVDWASVDVNVKLGMSNISSQDVDINWLESDEIEYVDYKSAKKRLEEVLAYFEKETLDTTFGDSVSSSVNSIEKQISKINVVKPNVKGLEKIKNDVVTYLNSEQSEYSNIADMINNDYDWFLAMVDSQSTSKKLKSELNTWQLLTFNLKLFDVDSSTRDTINTLTKTNPLETLVDNKKTIIDGYWNALKSNSASDLWLTQEQYLVLRDNIWTMKNQITTLYSVVRPISSTELIAKNSRVTTNKSLLSFNGKWSRLGSNMEAADVIDPSVLSKWIYDKIQIGPDAWKLTKIVYSDAFVDNIWDRYYDVGDNIVLWNEDSVYLKCPGQECAAWGWWYWWYYRSEVVKEIPYKETWLEFNKETKLKIADNKEEVKNWKVVWQTYDSLTFSWRLDRDADAYLIKLVDRIDYSYEKSDISSPNVLYILAVPEEINLEDLYSKNLKLELLKKIEKIEKLYGKELVQVVYYNSHKKLADVRASNLDRKWYYARITSLDLEGDTYKINSPRSNQVVAWKQMVWDDQAPDGNPILYRYNVPEITDQWDDLEWYVWTRYQLILNWKDNVALYYINLSKDWEILDEKYTSNVEDTVKTYIDIHTEDENEVYNAVWIDQFGNKTEKVINVHYSIPEITITDVKKNSDWESVAITAELSHDIDQWNVSFQRRRGNVWKTMKRKNVECADLVIWIWDWKVIWSPYSLWNEIAMYDKDGKVMALMDPKTAEIKFQTGYKDDYEVNVVVENSSVLQVCNKKTKDAVFSISIPTEKCLKIEADNYKVVDLPENGKMWMFNWWNVVYSKNGDNILFVSPSCHLYSEIWLEWTYSYDIWQESVVLTLYQMSDLSKSNPIKVWMKVKPFVEN